MNKSNSLFRKPYDINPYYSEVDSGPGFESQEQQNGTLTSFNRSVMPGTDKYEQTTRLRNWENTPLNSNQRNSEPPFHNASGVGIFDREISSWDVEKPFGSGYSPDRTESFSCPPGQRFSTTSSVREPYHINQSYREVDLGPGFESQVQQNGTPTSFNRSAMLGTDMYGQTTRRTNRQNTPLNSNQRNSKPSFHNDEQWREDNASGGGRYNRGVSSRDVVGVFDSRYFHDQTESFSGPPGQRFSTTSLLREPYHINQSYREGDSGPGFESQEQQNGTPTSFNGSVMLGTDMYGQTTRRTNRQNTPLNSNQRNSESSFHNDEQWREDNASGGGRYNRGVSSRNVVGVYDSRYYPDQTESLSCPSDQRFSTPAEAAKTQGNASIYRKNGNYSNHQTDAPYLSESLISSSESLSAATLEKNFQSGTGRFESSNLPTDNYPKMSDVSLMGMSGSYGESLTNRSPSFDLKRSKVDVTEPPLRSDSSSDTEEVKDLPDKIKDQLNKVKEAFNRLMEARDNPDAYSSQVGFCKDGLVKLMDVSARLELDYPMVSKLLDLDRISTTIIMGQQSVGKSSLMALISGNRSEISDGETSTKQPIIYHLKKGVAFSAETKRQRANGDFSDIRTFNNMRELSDYLARSQQAIKEDIVSDRLYVTIHSPDCLEQRFVDFPGDISDFRDEDREIREKHYKAFDSPFNIFIRVVKGSADIESDQRMGKLFASEAEKHPFRMIVQTYGQELAKRQLQIAKGGGRGSDRMLGVFNDGFYSNQHRPLEKTAVFCVDSSLGAVDQVCNTEVEKRVEKWKEIDQEFQNELHQLFDCEIGNKDSSANKDALKKAQCCAQLALSIKSLCEAKDFLLYKNLSIQIADIGRRKVPGLLKEYNHKKSVLETKTMEVYKKSVAIQNDELNTEYFSSIYRESSVFQEMMYWFAKKAGCLQGPLIVTENRLKDMDPERRNKLEKMSQEIIDDAYREETDSDSFLDIGEIPVEVQNSLNEISNSMVEMLEEVRTSIAKFSTSVTRYENLHENIPPVVNEVDLLKTILLQRHGKLVSLGKKSLEQFLEWMLKDIGTTDSEIQQRFLEVGCDESWFTQMLSRIRETAFRYLEEDFVKAESQTFALRGGYEPDSRFQEILKKYADFMVTCAAASSSLPDSPELSSDYLKAVIKLNKEKLVLGAKWALCGSAAVGGVAVAGAILSPLVAPALAVGGGLAVVAGVTGHGPSMGGVGRQAGRALGKAKSVLSSGVNKMTHQYKEAKEQDQSVKDVYHKQSGAIMGTFTKVGDYALGAPDSVSEEYAEYSNDGNSNAGNLDNNVVQLLAKLEYEKMHLQLEVGKRVFNQHAPGLFKTIVRELKEELSKFVVMQISGSEECKTGIPYQLKQTRLIIKDLRSIHEKIAELNYYLPKESLAGLTDEY